MSAFGLFSIFVFPGLLFAAPAGWFFVWIEHKMVARMQRRIGPPLLQPFWDFVKLTGKRTPARSGIEATLLLLYPVLSVLATIGALALLPALPAGQGFYGDGVLLVALLETPSICFILAGFTSASIYGEVGAIREAVLSLANNLVFLLSIVLIAVSAHSFQLQAMAGAKAYPGHWIGVFGILLCIPAKLRLNPFSTSSAEQEIYSGPLTECAGAALATWELAHGLEWVALTGLAATLAMPMAGPAWLHGLGFVACSVVEVLLFSLIAAATARLTLRRSVNFYWRWAAALAVLSILSAAYMRFRL